MAAGRPTKKTPARQKRICDAIRLGATHVLAAQAAGIGERTFYEWMQEKPQFAQAVKAAEGEAALVWLEKIEAAASDGNWQAAAWKLERRYPQMYGRTVQEHSGEQKLTIEYTNNWRTSSGAQGPEGDDGSGD